MFFTVVLNKKRFLSFNEAFITFTHKKTYSFTYRKGYTQP